MTSTSSTVPTADDLTAEIAALTEERSRTRGGKRGALTSKIKRLEATREELRATGAPSDAAAPDPTDPPKRGSKTRTSKRSGRKNPYIVVLDGEGKESRRFVRHVSIVKPGTSRKPTIVRDSKGRDLKTNTAALQAAAETAGIELPSAETAA